VQGGGRGDLRGFYASRLNLPQSDLGRIKAVVRREHTLGDKEDRRRSPTFDWINTTNTRGYFSRGDDPARVNEFAPMSPLRAGPGGVPTLKHSADRLR